MVPQLCPIKTAEQEFPTLPYAELLAQTVEFGLKLLKFICRFRLRQYGRWVMLTTANAEQKKGNDRYWHFHDAT
jgi:hypothetical protein